MNKKWNWMMEYCKNRGLPPAHEWAWKEAERMYIKFLENCSSCSSNHCPAVNGGLVCENFE